MSTTPVTVNELPGLNCGMCGVRTCADLAERMSDDPALLRRCIPRETLRSRDGAAATVPSVGAHTDSLGRRIDFYLEHFPEDPGPREVILPHNPMITRELEVAVGDILIGRPLGMSCGCPVTHCGVVREVDSRTGVIVWCVTGPLDPRRQGFKDLGYYTAEAYEGIVVEPTVEVRIGMRYFFQPRMCMLQWRHSGLVNFINRFDGGLQVRLEGLWIG